MKFNHLLSFQTKLFSFISICLLALMIYASYDWAPSNDERFQVPYADLSLDYYSTFGKNDTVLTTTTKIESVMKHYGIAIELPAHFLNRLFGWELYGIRHAMMTLVSFFYIFFGALLAKRITKSWTAAYLAMVFLVLTPRIFGEAFNNPKDPTYCATSLFSLYTFFVFLDSLPKPSWRNTILLGIGVAGSLLVRISGLISEFLFVIFLVWELYHLHKNKITIDLKDIAKKVFLAFSVGYFAGIVLWPAMINAPLTQPFEALAFLKNLPVTVKNLFEGKYLQSTEIPWYYLPKYFLISNPEVILIGILIGLFLFLKLKKVYNFRRISFLLISSFFPLFLIIYGKTGLLTGWRHGYFIYIPLVIFSAISYSYIHTHLVKTEIKKKIILGIIGLGLLPTVYFMIKNYPLFYVYFNPTFGGVKKALGNYELDYYSHSIMPAIKWLEKNEAGFERKKIASNNGFQVFEIMKPKYGELPIVYTRYRERYDQDWDYNILTQSFVDAQYLRNGYFGASKDVIKTIDVDGVPVCAILKRQDKNDFYGKRALDSNNFPKAIELLTKALQYDANNEIAWTNLGFAQLNSNQPNEAVNSLSNALKISPESIMAKNYLAYAYLQSGNLPYAQSVLMNLIEENPNMPEPYRLLAQIYQQQGNVAMAQQYMNIYQQITGQMGGQ
jgi:tetratricopeptide (TPR) repeat protein